LCSGGRIWVIKHFLEQFMNHEGQALQYVRLQIHK
jgi:hypothetical protein